MVEVVLLVLEAVGGELHLQARGGEGAVGAEDEVGGHGALLLRLRMLEAGGGRVQVDAGAALVEVDGRARLLGEGHQLAVEQAPAGGVDRLAFLAVALVAKLALHRMQHAAVHGDSHLADRFLDAHAFQAAPAAVGEREVDRLARGDVGLPHVGAAFVHGDLVAAADEVDGQEGADQSGTQQGDVLLCGHDAIGMAWSVSRRGRIPGADRIGTRLRRSYRAARGRADHVGFAPVDDHAVGLQGFEDLAVFGRTIIESWQPRCAGSAGVMISTGGRSCCRLICATMYSKYAVSSRLFRRRAPSCRPSRRRRARRAAAIEKTGALLCCQSVRRGPARNCAAS